METKLQWSDGKRRCAWANPKNERYIRYHDEEWGVPVYEDGKLFEMLILETFQAGLSWECVLNKRDTFRLAFDGFDPEKVKAYQEEKIDRLLSDPGIIRNGRKIRAAVKNAEVFLRDPERIWILLRVSLGIYGWKGPCGTGARSNSPLSDALSKDLKKRGMSFVGTTVMYAYLQAVGVINSHEEDCFLSDPAARFADRKAGL